VRPLETQTYEKSVSNPTFTSVATDRPPPDSSKHVNYTQGMVLGVDDFQQEFAYLSSRDQWLARDAIGYGTVSGLHVAFDPLDQNSLSVSPGVAINPRGQLIRVAAQQCAKLDDWLALPATIQRMSELGVGANGAFTAYVVLCYRDCPTDEVPLPGELSRCDTDTMAASRIIDDFRLELTLTPPRQLEEDAVRDFVAWLRKIKIGDFDPAPGEPEAFLQAIKDAVGNMDSPPPLATGLLLRNPPADLRIPRQLVYEWIRAALRLWVTELRPIWQTQCAPDDMACECLLLAEVRINLTGGIVTETTLDEKRRPFLVHSRMLQELLLCLPC
jgi:hypothetical protein